MIAMLEHQDWDSIEKIGWPIQAILAAEREHCRCPNDTNSMHKQYELYASYS